MLHLLLVRQRDVEKKKIQYTRYLGTNLFVAFVIGPPRGTWKKRKWTFSQNKKAIFHNTRISISLADKLFSVYFYIHRLVGGPGMYKYRDPDQTYNFFFWSLFNVRAMFNRYCDRLDKKQPDSVRG